MICEIFFVPLPPKVELKLKVMKGLDRYIAKHGRHFTLELAMDVTKKKWNPSKIEKETQKNVYYNVTGSTRGDMVYMMDMFKYFLSSQYTHKKGMLLMLKWVGDYKKTGSPFCMWLSKYDRDGFDFTPYI